MKYDLNLILLPTPIFLPYLVQAIMNRLLYLYINICVKYLNYST